MLVLMSQIVNFLKPNYLFKTNCTSQNLVKGNLCGNAQGFSTQWRIQGAPPARAPTGPDSFVLTYKFFET